MKWLKATYASNDFHDGETEFFNLDKILNIQPYKNGTAKILMGGGLYWNVYIDSIEILDLGNNDLKTALQGGEKSC